MRKVRDILAAAMGASGARFVPALFAGALFAGALAACGKPDPAMTGKAAFTGFGCVKCHQVDGVGGKYGPDLTFVGFRKDAAWLDQWLKNPHAWNNKTMMPNFHLPEDIRKGLVEYLAGLKGGTYVAGAAPWDQAELKSDAVARGAVIFDKAGCITCHGQRGGGGYPNNNVAGGLIPALTLAADGYSKHELGELLHKGRNSAPVDPSEPAPMLRMPPWGEVLKEDEIHDVIEYVYSLRPKDAGEAW